MSGRERTAEEWAEFKSAHDGKLPAITFPGGYSILYLTVDGDSLCPDCANGDAGWTLDEPEDDDTLRMDGERIVCEFIHWEGAADYCAGCNKDLPSEYGDPDAVEVSR